MRVIWAACGFLAFAIGVIGAFVPLLPTVPLMLLAAFCFARSSPRLHDWLVNHPTFGPSIRDWQAHGAIHPRAKRLATLSVALAFGLSIALGVGQVLLIVQAIVLIGVLVFIWSRPPA